MSSPGKFTRIVVATAALGLGLAACTTASSENGSGSGDSGGTTNGVTADSIAVGYQIVDLGKVQDMLGFVTVNYGGYDTISKGVQAIVNYVNANGGVGGRSINPVIRRYEGIQDSPAYAEAECKGFTQDSKVFAVIMDGQFQNNARPCYQAARTVMLDQTLLAHDTKEFESFAPYLWSPSGPEFSAFVNQQIDVMQSSGWFNGAQKVAVVAPDGEVGRRITNDVVVPKIKGLGISQIKSFYVDSSNTTTLLGTSGATMDAIAKYGADRVFMAGGARILSVLAETNEANAINAKYSISSLDSPSFFTDNPDAVVSKVLVGMAGMGYQAANDMRLNSSPDPFPNPNNPQETLCKKIVDDAGASPPEQNRENYRVVFDYCDGTFFMKAALDKASKDVTPESFRDAVWGLGTSWQGALATATDFKQGGFAGASAGRGMYWDGTCALTGRPPTGCFKYGSGPLPFNVVSAAPTP